MAQLIGVTFPLESSSFFGRFEPPRLSPLSTTFVQLTRVSLEALQGCSPEVAREPIAHPLFSIRAPLPAGPSCARARFSFRAPSSLPFPLLALLPTEGPTLTPCHRSMILVRIRGEEESRDARPMWWGAPRGVRDTAYYRGTWEEGEIVFSSKLPLSYSSRPAAPLLLLSHPPRILCTLPSSTVPVLLPARSPYTPHPIGPPSPLVAPPPVPYFLLSAPWRPCFLRPSLCLDPLASPSLLLPPDFLVDWTLTSL
ncbi:hypothetical protein FB451DRAFT_1500865 [Mycena latifolia]|nr:hypothetical protein FB451DRAFT_1500865 [Mycena latifolia]